MIEFLGEKPSDDFVDLSFTDPRDRHLATQYIMTKKSNAFETISRVPIAEADYLNEPYHIHRLFRMIFESGELIGNSPLNVNADFINSISLKPNELIGSQVFAKKHLSKPILKRASVFLVTEKPISSYDTEKFVRDNRALLFRHVNPTFDKKLSELILTDKDGKKAALITSNQYNIAVGFYNYGECDQGVFEHDGMFYSRLKYIDFEEHIRKEKEKMSESIPSE